MELRRLVRLWRFFAFLSSVVGGFAIWDESQASIEFFCLYASIVMGTGIVLIWWVRFGSKLDKPRREESASKFEAV